MQDKLGYKPFIDGLRAIAVSIVLLFHLFPDSWAGGYLGVDIFFVISGFVITQSLYKTHLEKGHISIKEFYVRRFKRLYMALFAMLAVTTLAYLFFGFQWDTNLFVKSAVSAFFASSNLYFLFHGTPYFHSDLINPLLHTWSLGIEEQFYLIYPAVLIVGLWAMRKWQFRPATFGAAILLVSAALYGLFVFGETPWGDFYSPFARFWELGIGCTSFFTWLPLKEFRFQKIVSLLLSLMGGACIVLLQFSQQFTNDIHAATLAVTLATASLLFSGVWYAGPIIRLLETRLLTYLGRISYSLYLWHLPVIYFATLYAVGIYRYAVWAVAGSIACAVVSYHCIEKPLRYSKRFGEAVSKAFTYLPYVAAVVLLVVGGTVVAYGRGAMSRLLNTSLNSIALQAKKVNYIERTFGLGDQIQAHYTINGNDVSTCGYTDDAPVNDLGLRDDCLKHTDNGTLYYLVGDSHALHFAPMFDAASTVSNLYFMQVSRQLFVPIDPGTYDPQMLQTMMADQVQEMKKLHKTFHGTVIALSFYFDPQQDQIDLLEKNLRTYIETLSPYAHILLIAPTPVFTSGPEACVLTGTHCTIDTVQDQERRAAVLSLFQKLANDYASVALFDPYEAICPERECRIYIPAENLAIYLDTNHLTPAASRRLGPFFDSWLREHSSKGEWIER